jgi:hypothetical protein
MDTTESRSFAARLADLLRNEQHAMADFLVALAEFDRQRGWLELGYSGLFPFLHRLGLSKAASFFRMKAAELIQRYPEIVEPLEDGRLCITTMASLAKVLTPTNRAEVLPRFFHRSGVEAKAIVAELAPAASPPTKTIVTVTPLRPPLPRLPGRPSQAEDRGSSGEPRGPDESTLDSAGALAVERSPTVRAEPLTPTETRLHITVSPEFLDKLEAARLALSHAMPGASAEGVLTAGLDLVLDRAAKRKGLVAKPRPAPANAPAGPGAATIPAAVRREVWARDQGKCQWPIDGGGICGSELRPELDHVHLKCRGARPIASGIRVLCHLHNQLAARLALGNEVMDQYTRDPRQAGLFASSTPNSR